MEPADVTIPCVGDLPTKIRSATTQSYIMVYCRLTPTQCFTRSFEASSWIESVADDRVWRDIIGGMEYDLTNVTTMYQPIASEG